MRALFAAASFLSAFLLFALEPFLAKLALPAFGGSPSVWNVALAFFQCALLAGYVYADRLKAKRAGLQIILLAAGLAFLPVRLAGWPLAWAGARPALSLLACLAASAGLPFVALAANGPLLQSWFADAGGGDPYWLYSAGNVGSLAALISYPFIIEPLFGLRAQGRLWTSGYVALALLVAWCARRASRPAALRAPAPQPKGKKSKEKEAAAPSPPRWLALAAVPAGLSLAVTNFLSTEVASVPFVWTLPLAIYLSTLAIAFGPGEPARRRWAVKALPWALLLWAGVMSQQHFHPLLPIVALHLALLFVAALACHVELYERRPPAGELTRYFLWTAAGGASGGLFVAIVAPLIFTSLAEYPLLLMAAVALGWRRRPRVLSALGAGAAAAVLAMVCGVHSGRLYSHRDFFGEIRVIEDPTHMVHLLTNGNTTHGTEIFVPAMTGKPLAYYDEAGPAGQLMTMMRSRLGAAPAKVAVIGLGAGTMAAYARPRDEWVFYEINPALRSMAYDYKLFTFMMGCGPACHVVTADGRLGLAAVPDSSYDAVVVDAFGSDAIPTHLLTREALALYFRKLKPHGFVAFHVTSRHSDFTPLLARLGRDAGVVALAQHRFVDDSLTAWGIMESQWVVMARENSDFTAPVSNSHWSPARAKPGVQSWSDDYSSPLAILFGL